MKPHDHPAFWPTYTAVLGAIYAENVRIGLFHDDYRSDRDMIAEAHATADIAVRMFIAGDEPEGEE